MTHMILRRCLLALLPGLGLLGCIQPDRDLGELYDDPPPPSEEPVEQAEFTSDFAGDWIGEADDALSTSTGSAVYRFPSGSTQIRLKITAASDATGTITFGQEVPPAAATNPDLGYPPDPNFQAPLIPDSQNLPPVEGYPHILQQNLSDLSKVATDFETILSFGNAGRVLDGRLELSFFTDEVFLSWCALQTDTLCETLALNGGGVSYLGDNQCSARVDGADVPIDCQKGYLCETDRCNFGSRISYLTLRRTSTGLAGTFNDAVVLNERGFRTWLGAVRFVPAPSAVASQPQAAQ